MAILVNMVTYGFVIYSYISEFKFLNWNAVLNSSKLEYLEKLLYQNAQTFNCCCTERKIYNRLKR